MSTRSQAQQMRCEVETRWMSETQNSYQKNREFRWTWRQDMEKKSFQNEQVGNKSSKHTRACFIWGPKTMNVLFWGYVSWDYRKKNSIHTTQVSALYTVTHKQAERWTWKMRIINRFSPQEVEPREYDETSEGKELGPSSFMGTQRWKVRWKWRHVRINQKGKGDMKSDSKALRR